MSTNVYFTTPTKITKRDKIELLYKDFQVELFKHIDLTYLFPSYNDLDVADLVFTISFIFPSGCHIENVIRELIIIKGVEINEEIIIVVIPIIEKFLKQFHSI
jgi:hypothetical protein